MEKTIEIVKDFLKHSSCEECQGATACDDCYIERTQVEAIKKLLKGYRELEEAHKTLHDLYWNDSIPKSKIKEKIEEYKKKEKCEKGKYCNNCCTYYSRCKLLQELMEG